MYKDADYVFSLIKYMYDTATVKTDNMTVVPYIKYQKKKKHINRFYEKKAYIVISYMTNLCRNCYVKNYNRLLNKNQFNNMLSSSLNVSWLFQHSFKLQIIHSVFQGFMFCFVNKKRSVTSFFKFLLVFHHSLENTTYMPLQQRATDVQNGVMKILTTLIHSDLTQGRQV